jgi:FimV-like protein
MTSNMTCKKLHLWRLCWGPVALACSLAVASPSAQALSLGRFSVQSNLGEPLRAEVEITQFSIEDLRSLKTQLAAPTAFERAGIGFHPALVDAQVSMEVRQDGRPFIVLAGRTPAMDNFIDLILETQWASGRLAMNYTLLLSPGKTPTANSAKEPIPGLPPNTVTEKVEPPINSTTPLADPVFINTEGRLIVRPGDTAAKIALKYLPPQVSLAQMLVAMVRTNPDAFIEGNVNWIRADATLKMPDAQEAAQTPADEAQQAVVQQTANFAAYAQRLAHSPVKAAPTPLGREASGVISPNAAKVTPEERQQDKLTLSKGQVSTNTAEAKLAQALEAKATAEQMAALNKNVQSLKALVPASEPTNASSEPRSESPVVIAPLTSPNVSLLDSMTQKPVILGGIAALLAALGGLMLGLRRKSSDRPALWTEHETSPTVTATAPITVPDGWKAELAKLDLSLDTPITATTTSSAAEPSSAPESTPEQATQAPLPAPANSGTDQSKLTLAVQLLEKGEVELARALIQSVAASATGELQMQARQLLGQSE